MRENVEISVSHSEREAAAVFAATGFIKSASKLKECPADTGREIAFAGRSNAGKSSALNALTGRSRLARTSKTPGRTQLLNFFSLRAEGQRLVDLPGYGYAKVPIEVRDQWQKEIDRYLSSRHSLVGLILLMDIRHPLQKYDQQMLEWAASCQMPVHVLLTKVDKLKRGPAMAALHQVEKALAALGGPFSAQLFSSTRGDGVHDARCLVLDWLAGDGADEAWPEEDGEA